MDTLQAIENRHSIRTFQRDAAVSEEALKGLLRAGLSAPSARNGRPWEIIVVRNADTLKRLSEVRGPWHFLASAPLAILIGGKDAKYLQQDCAAAAENILLAATALGLGACWLGLYPNLDAVVRVQEIAGLPGDILPVMVIAVGRPAETAQVSPRTIDWSKIHFERFGGRK